MKKMKHLAIIVICCFWTIAGIAQISVSPTLTTVTSPEEQKIQEVYGTQFFIGNPELKAQFVKLLKDRIRYESMPIQTGEKFMSLANVPLLNKLNPALIRDALFDQQQFNPLKYQMEFWSKKTEVYRINPNVVIVISPQ